MNCYKMFRLIEKIYAFAFVSLSVFGLGVIFYWNFVQDDQIITDFDSNSYIVGSIDNIVYAGKPMLINRSYCLKSLDYVGKVSRRFSNHIIYNVPAGSTSSVQTKLGCKDRIIQVDVPSNLPSDHYIYETTITYRINPIKEVIYKLPPIKLQVVNPVYDELQKIAKEELKKK